MTPDELAIAQALHHLHTEPFDCTHCRRTIPCKMVVDLDCSGCPLNPPCIVKGHGILTAWPGPLPGDDDDDRDPAAPKPAPVGSSV